MLCKSQSVEPVPVASGEKAPSQTSRSLVSVVVPCRNEIKHVRQFLDCVFRQELGDFDIEVMVADGMSTDGTRAVLVEYQAMYPALCLVDNPSKIVSIGLNKTIRKARGEIILRMDVHTTYAPDYILRCVETLRTTGADNVGGPTRTLAEGKVAQAIAIAYHTRFASGGAKFHDPTYEGYVDTVTYGCWRRATLQRIGLFDESLTRNQDDELNFRIVRMGGRIWQSKQIVLWYWPRTDLVSLAKQYFQYGFWKVFVIRKHGRPASYRHLVPVACLAGTLGLWAVVGLGRLTGHAPLSQISLVIWLVCAALYAAASIVTSVTKGRPGGYQVMALLPIIFAVYHLSYGCGFLVGLFSRLGKTAEPTPLSGTVEDLQQ